MKIPGFPSEEEILSSFGYVTDEDRDRWDRMKAASDERMAASGTRLSARELAAQAASPAVSMAERGIQAQMVGAQTAEEGVSRAARPKVRVEHTTTRTRVTEEEVKEGADGPELG